jgi:uncharacterized protein YutE (UPF0331/DUF86 family)
MDIEVIRAKQDSIARCIGRIQSKADLSYEELLEDYDAQDVITLNLERAVQQACDIAAMILADTTEPPADTMRGAFESLQRIQALSGETAGRMMKAVGFRNTAVHAYQQIDWTIVHKITHERLNDFSTFVREIDQYIDKTEQTEKPAD